MVLQCILVGFQSQGALHARYQLFSIDGLAEQICGFHVQCTPFEIFLMIPCNDNDRNIFGPFAGFKLL